MEPSAPLRLPAYSLFFAFFRAGIMGFGGVMPMARRVLVEERRWMTPAEFSELLALCQFLPGANVANMSVIFGSRVCGPLGSIAALAGLLVAPVAIVLGIATLYAQYGDDPPVRHLVTGLSAGAAGLILATAVKIAAPLRASPWRLGVLAAAFAALGLVRLPFLPSLGVLAAASITLANWRLRE